MSRIFVAIDISRQAKRSISAHVKFLQKQFPNLRVGWEKEKKLHLTLKFLGEINESELKKLKEVVSQIADLHPVLHLKIAGTGVFPNQRKAKILWAGIEDERGILQKIKQTLENELEQVGYEKEKRIYKPHLTIARLREPDKSKNLIEQHLKNKFEPVEFEVSQIVIYESELKPNGSVYRIISRHKLN